MSSSADPVVDDAPPESEESDIGADIDPEDPMRDFIIAQRREERASKQKKHKKHKDETPEERRARKERKKEKKAKKKLLGGRSDAMRDVEELLKSLGSGGPGDDGQRASPRRSGSRSPSPSRRDRHRARRSRSPEPHSRPRRRYSSGSRSPRRR